MVITFDLRSDSTMEKVNWTIILEMIDHYNFMSYDGGYLVYGKL